MIFVTLGTQKFQFDRLLKKLDQLVETGKIKKEELAVQCVYSEYTPKNYEIFAMKPQNEIEEYMKNADIIITHSGTGSIITALKLNKRLIIVPRLKEYGEHVDNHQIELAEVFKEKVNALVVTNMEELEQVMKKVYTHEFGEWHSDNETLINSINQNIQSF